MAIDRTGDCWAVVEPPLPSSVTYELDYFERCQHSGVVATGWQNASGGGMRCRRAGQFGLHLKRSAAATLRVSWLQAPLHENRQTLQTFPQRLRMVTLVATTNCSLRQARGSLISTHIARRPWRTSIALLPEPTIAKAWPLVRVAKSCACLPRISMHASGLLRSTEP